MSEVVERIWREHLARRIHHLIILGQLPLYDSGPVWAGSGDRSECLICRRPIELHQLRYTFQRTEQAADFHVLCFLAWEEASLKGSPNTKQ